MMITFENQTIQGITIDENKSLETLEGLNPPTRIDATNSVTATTPVFSIVRNESLRSLKGLEKIEETRNVDWQITDNIVLESLDGRMVDPFSVPV